MNFIFVIISEYVPSDTCVPIPLDKYEKYPPRCEENEHYRVQLRNFSVFECYDKTFCGTYIKPDIFFRNCNTPDDIVQP